MIKLTSAETRQTAFYHGIHPLLAAAAVRMAAERVPIVATARVLGVPCSDVRALLLSAKNCGDIAVLPCEDWHQMQTSKTDHTVKAQPTLGADPLSQLDEDELVSLCARVFSTTRLQSRLLIPLLKRSETRRDTLHELINSGNPNRDLPTNEKMVDVVIYHIRRKLLPHGLAVLTERARGFFMTHADQRKARRLLVEALVSH